LYRKTMYQLTDNEISIRRNAASTDCVSPVKRDMPMKKNLRIRIDANIRIGFRIISFFSLIALIAMLSFVFYEGITPFISPTSSKISIVAEHIDHFWINGQEYRNHRTSVDAPADADKIIIEFINDGEKKHIPIALGGGRADTWEDILEFPDDLQHQISSPEAYTYTISFPGALAGMDQKFHITLPEPRQKLTEFILGTEWRPVYKKLYGILPMITATLLTTAGALLIGVPIALLSSVLIAEFLSKRFGGILRSAIDLLAGIPSVVYGFFGLMVIVPFIQRVFGSASGSSLLAAVIVLSIMILPIIVSITITSLRSVPASYREASIALGATRMQTAWHTVVPAAKSGIIASIILGTARAVGETMAVILVAGNSPQFPSSLTDSIRTMTASIALEMGYSAGRHRELLFSIGIILFIIIILLNAAIMKLRNSAKEHS